MIDWLRRDIVIWLKTALIFAAALILWLFYLKLAAVSASAKSSITPNHQAALPNASSNNYELVLEKSIFIGLNKNAKPYKIVAATAMKITTDQYRLVDVQAQYPLTNDYQLVICAQNGDMDDHSKLLSLSKQVKILAGGAELKGAELNINLANQVISSQAPVDLHYHQSTVTADSFTSAKNNNLIIFKGNVMTKIHLTDF